MSAPENPDSSSDSNSTSNSRDAASSPRPKDPEQSDTPPEGTARQSNTAPEGAVFVGKAHGAFGVRGWIRVQSFTEVPTDILSYQPWLMDGREYRVLEGKPHGQGLVARLEAVEDRDVAQAMHGLDIAVPESQLPAAQEGEYYWRDLLGLEVKTTEGVSLGVIESMMETGSNDVMVVKGERERLLPWIDSTLVSVDIEAGVITVDWDPEF